MTLQQMRNFISEAYPGQGWRVKVACMQTNQVIAVYKSLMERGYNKDATKTVLETDTSNHQIDIFEYMRELEDKETHTDIKL